MPKVLTEEEIYDIEVAIYNDDNKALFKSLPKGIEDANDKDVIKELAKGQEYYISPQSNIMLRKDGRVLNIKFLRSLKPMWTPNDLLLIVKGSQIRFSEIYKLKNWKFDHNAIVKTYIDNKWGMSVTNGYRDKYKELYF